MRPTPSLAQESTADAVPPLADALLHYTANRRILIVDDNPSIHQDFRKVLGNHERKDAGLISVEAELFGERRGPDLAKDFELDSAHQGQEAFEKIKAALEEGKPYAMAFVDVRMPPGWDGIETVARIWELYPELQVVICTAYSDYSWEEMVQKLNSPSNLVILKKPFDAVEVLQLAHAFTRKWELNCQARLKLDELAALVAERTRDLEALNQQLRREVQERLETEEQLRQAQKMEAIGQLAAGVAHDFNNILTIVQGYASMLEASLQGPQAKAAAAILKAGERASSLVRQLLLFSRKRIMQFQDLDLNEAIANSSAMLRQLVGEHITLQTDCAPDVPPIRADRGMIEQVIVNLTVNARDAVAKEGRIQIQSRVVNFSPEAVRANPEARPGRFVCLSVSDNGSGISPEHRPHLFEPFFTTKPAGKGTGLGLATVYGIIRQHRGWIDVESAPGAGTTFRVYLPGSDKRSESPASTPASPPDPHGSETILLAEDEAALRDLVVDLLTARGYRVLAADSGPAALAVWKNQSNQIDLLLTDMIMPGGMMGTDLANELRRTNPKLKVIITTGYSPGVVIEQHRLREGLNFLPKPYAPAKLAEVVRTCLDS